MTFCRFFFAWVVLFGSKFVILEAIATLFGDNVRFDGIFHGISHSHRRGCRDAHCRGSCRSNL
jgi:hypothetical protein